MKENFSAVIPYTNAGKHVVKEENARIYGGIKTKDMPELLENRSINTIEKLIKELTRQGLIVRRGSKKSGGYHTLKDI